MKSLSYRIGHAIGEALVTVVTIGAVAVAVATCTSLIAGCCPAPSWPVELHFDEEFTNEEVFAMVTAIAEWDVATGTHTASVVLGHPHGLTLDDWSDFDKHVVHRLREDESVTKLWRAEGSRFVGRQGGGSIAIAIDYVRDMPYLTHIFSHELGHLFGICGHRPNTLMHGNSGDDLWCIDSLVLEEVCDLQGTCVEPRSTCE
jgi:hypothetical protein